MIRSMLLLLLLASTSLGQFVAKADIVTGMSGLVNPRISGQQVIFDRSSKPVLAEIAIVTVDPTAKSALVVAMKSIFDTVQLQPSDDGTYGFSGAGEYAVHVTIVNADGVLKFENLKVALSESEPIEPDIETLSPLARQSREAMRMFVESISTNYRQLAIETKSGKLKTVVDASVEANTLDLASRTEFKKRMGSLMEPELGVGPLPPNAVKTFDDIAVGFGGVK